MEYLAVEGLQYLVMMKSEVREIVVQRFGMSPAAPEVMYEALENNWLDISMMERVELVMVDDDCAVGVSTDIPDSYLGFVGRGQLGAVPATNVQAIMRSGARFGPACYAKVEIPVKSTEIPIKGELDGSEQMVSSVVREAVSGELGSSGGDLEGSVEQLVDMVIAEKKLVEFDQEVAVTEELEHVVVEHKLSKSMPVASQDGFCYIEMYKVGYAGTAVEHLGCAPMVRHALLYYLVAARRGVASNMWRPIMRNGVVHIERTDRAEGSCWELAVKLARLVTLDFPDVRVAGYLGCAYLGLGNFASPVCPACVVKTVFVSEPSVRCDCGCEVTCDEVSGEVKAAVRKLPSLAPVVAMRDDGNRLASSVGDCGYGPFEGERAFAIPMHFDRGGVMSVSVRADAVMVVMPAGTEFEMQGCVCECTESTVVLGFGLLKLTVLKGLNEKDLLYVRVGGRSAVIRWSHKWLGEDPYETFSRFWTKTGSNMMVASFGRGLDDISVEGLAASWGLYEFGNPEGFPLVDENSCLVDAEAGGILERKLIGNGPRTLETALYGTQVEMLRGVAIRLYGFSDMLKRVSRGLQVVLKEVSAVVLARKVRGLLLEDQMCEKKDSVKGSTYCVKMMYGVDDYGLDDGGPSGDEGFFAEY